MYLYKIVVYLTPYRCTSARASNSLVIIFSFAYTHTQTMQKVYYTFIICTFSATISFITGCERGRDPSVLPKYSPANSYIFRIKVMKYYTVRVNQLCTIWIFKLEQTFGRGTGKKITTATNAKRVKVIRLRCAREKKKILIKIWKAAGRVGLGGARGLRPPGPRITGPYKL